MSEWMSDADRVWLDTMEETISIVRMMFADRALLLMLSGAVFALHQDMLKRAELTCAKSECSASEFIRPSKRSMT
jgi:hypothetical protein